MGKLRKKIRPTHHRSGLSQTIHCVVMLCDFWGQFLTQKELKIFLMLICKICSSIQNDCLPDNCSDYSESAVFCLPALSLLPKPQKKKKHYKQKKNPHKANEVSVWFLFLICPLTSFIFVLHVTRVWYQTVFRPHTLTLIVFLKFHVSKHTAATSHWTASNLNDLHSC